ncbi:cupin domain-containing protein [Rhizobium sp. KVB221]|uniref:Cupin domain-containing protein n=2 Tax=Rhizobium setariae TaxID=2801340 RepID=A0A936YIH9_9HYPH|nr:cupin domain-containing protein [Rhizobium setariae]
MHNIPGKIANGADRYKDAVHFLNGRFDCKVSAADTSGAMCIFDTFRDKIGGPPLHYHELQDEWFMVLQGDFLFQVGEERYRLAPGDSIFGPRMVPHAFRNLTIPARLLIVYSPALKMEAFFRAGLGPDSAASAEFEALHKEHNIINVGPPLSAEHEDM